MHYRGKKKRHRRAKMMYHRLPAWTLLVDQAVVTGPAVLEEWIAITAADKDPVWLKHACRMDTDVLIAKATVCKAQENCLFAEAAAIASAVAIHLGPVAVGKFSWWTAGIPCLGVEFYSDVGSKQKKKQRSVVDHSSCSK